MRLTCSIPEINLVLMDNDKFVREQLTKEGFDLNRPVLVGRDAEHNCLVYSQEKEEDNNGR